APECGSASEIPPTSGPAPQRRRRLRLALAGAATAAAIASYGQWGGALGLPWSRAGDELPPLLFPLPLLAAAAALAAWCRPAGASLRSPLGETHTPSRPEDERGRARFLLFALAAV